MLVLGSPSTTPSTSGSRNHAVLLFLVESNGEHVLVAFAKAVVYQLIFQTCEAISICQVCRNNF